MNSKSVSSVNSWSSSLSSWSEQQFVSSYQLQILQPSIPEYTCAYNDSNHSDGPEYPNQNHMVQIPSQFKRPLTGIQQPIKLKQNNSLSLFSGIYYQQKVSNAKFSRKVFIGGLPPDISESIYIKIFIKI